MAKCYIRNGVWAWSVERQEKALGDMLDRDRLYQDTLTADRAKRPSRVSPVWLSQRAAMLRPTARRSEEIHVATLLALAVSEADLVDVLAIAAGRKTTIVAHDSGMVVEPGGASVIAAAVADWQRGRSQARTEPGRLEGVRVAAEKKRRRTTALVRDARPLWRDKSPTRMSAEEISIRVGLSVKTLYAELGRRPSIDMGRST